MLGGADVAANLVQHALASLGSCQAITYRIWAAQLGIELAANRGGEQPVTKTLAVPLTLIDPVTHPRRPRHTTGRTT